MTTLTFNDSTESDLSGLAHFGDGVTTRETAGVADRTSQWLFEVNDMASSTSPLESARTHETASATKPEDFRAIEQTVTALSEITAPEDLEDGLSTPLVPVLQTLLSRYGAGAAFELAGAITSGRFDPDVAAWILRWLGRIGSGPLSSRRWLLERNLRSPVPAIRDGAALGLESLADPHAAPLLRSAMQNERYSRIRRNMNRALQKIQTTA